MADLKEIALALSLTSNSGKLHRKRRRQNLRLLLRPSNQTTVLSVEKPVFFATKESYASQSEHEEHVGNIFLAVWALFFRNIFPHAARFTSINTGIFAASEGEYPPKTSRTMAKPELVDSP
jgi:hypothetical protein